MGLISGAFVLMALAIAPGAAAAVASWRPAGNADTDHETINAVATDAWVRGIAVGLSTFVLVGAALLRAHMVNAGGVIAATVLVVGASGIVAWRWRPTTTLRPLLGPAGWIGGAFLLACVPLIATHFGAPNTVLPSTPYYYVWNIAEVAHNGGAPATLPEWGTNLPTLNTYPGFVGSVAGLSVGGTVLSAVAIARVLFAGAAGVAAWLLARRLGARPAFALGGVAVLVSATIIFTKLTELRPEAAGYSFVFLTGAAALQFLATKRPIDLAAAALCTAGANVVHPLGWVFAMVFVAAAAAADLCRRNVRAHLRTAGALVGAVVVATLGCAALTGRLIPGGDELGTLPGLVDGTDPTWRFLQLTAGFPDSLPAPSNRALFGDALRKGFFQWSGNSVIVAGGIVALFALGMCFVTPRRDRSRCGRSLAFLAVAAVALVAIAVWSSTSAPTYVPRRTGVWRMGQLLILFVPITAAVALSMLRPPRLRAAAAWALPLIAAGILWTARSDISGLRNARPSDAQRAAVQSLRLPAGSLILANGYTEGYLPFEAGTPGLLDGRAPYTPRNDLLRANALLEESRAYFADPAAAPFDFAGTRVTHVLAATEPWFLATTNTIPADVTKLRADPRLDEIRSGPGYVVFRVRPESPAQPGS